MARQALTAFPPTVELFADGTVHASFQIPLSILDVGDAVGVHEDSNLVVLKINGNYTPSLGLIWCFLGETRSLAQTRITHHRSEQELPAFLRGGGHAIWLGHLTTTPVSRSTIQPTLAQPGALFINSRVFMLCIVVAGLNGEEKCLFSWLPLVLFELWRWGHTARICTAEG